MILQLHYCQSWCVCVCDISSLNPACCWSELFGVLMSFPVDLVSWWSRKVLFPAFRGLGFCWRTEPSRGAERLGANGSLNDWSTITEWCERYFSACCALLDESATGVFRGIKALVRSRVVTLISSSAALVLMHYALTSFFIINTKSPPLSAFDGLWWEWVYFFFFFFSFLDTQKPNVPSVPCDFFFFI